MISGKKSIILVNKSENGITESVKNFCAGKENVIEFSVKNEIGIDDVIEMTELPENYVGNNICRVKNR